MAAATMGIVLGGATLLQGHQQRKDAKKAARRQAQGVAEAQRQTQMATEAARNALNSGQSPRQDLLSGIEGQMGFADQGFAQASQTINPLAQLSRRFMGEQTDLLGLGGQAAQQAALSRVSDPLAAEQERAILRNNAALGGVGGNVLSQLAEQTRARTEANIGNRLGQLSAAGAPALGALQQLTNLRLNRGLTMGDITGQGGISLANQEAARRQALANVELGQGSQMSQLAQNMGTARAGGAAFAAQQSPITDALSAGLGGFLGMGGALPGTPQVGGIQNPNTFNRIA